MPELYLNFTSAAMMTGGILTTLGWVIFAIVDPNHQDYKHPRWFPLNGLIILGGLLLVIGLPGIYLRLASAAGLLGLIAFIILFTGLAIAYIAVHSIETATMPNIPAMMRGWVAVAVPCLFIGSLLMALVFLQTNLYPAPTGYLLIGATLLGILTVLPDRVPAWLGRNLVSAVWTAFFAWLGLLTLTL